MATKTAEFRSFTEAEKGKLPVWLVSRLNAYRVRKLKGQPHLQVQRSGFKVDMPETPLDLVAYKAWLKGRVSNVGTLVAFLKSQEGWVQASVQDARLYQRMSEIAALYLDHNAALAELSKLETENRLLRECRASMQRANVASMKNLKLHLEANNIARSVLRRREAFQREKLFQLRKEF